MGVKDPMLLPLAEELFGEDGVRVTLEGKSLIGAAIGTEAFRHDFVKSKVEKWVLDSCGCERSYVVASCRGAVW